MNRPALRRPTDWPQYLASRAETARHPLLRDFYRADWPGADTPLAELEFAALDIETTGLDPSQHAIVSIGLIPFTLERIRSHQAWYQLVRPQGDLTAESVTFHQITHADIQRAPRFEDILQGLLEQLAGRIAVVHFRNIERPFLDRATTRRWGGAAISADRYHADRGAAAPAPAGELVAAPGGKSPCPSAWLTAANAMACRCIRRTTP